MNTELNEPESSDVQISLLSLLLLVVQNLWLLLISPVLVGLGAFVVMSFLPPRFESQAVQMGDAQLMGIYNSAQVRDAVIRQIRYAKKEEDLDSARERLANDLRVSFNSKDKTITILAKAAMPLDAQRMSEQAIAQANLANRGRLDDIERLRSQYDRTFQRAFEQPSSIGSASARTSAPLSKQNDQGQVVDPGKDLQQLAFLADTLAKVQRFDLLQPPTLPTKPLSNKRSLIAVLAAIVTGSVLLLFVFVRQSLRQAVQDPESARSLGQIQIAWRQAMGRLVA